MRPIDLEHGAEAAAGNREDTREDTVVLRRILPRGYWRGLQEGTAAGRGALTDKTQIIRHGSLPYGKFILPGLSTPSLSYRQAMQSSSVALSGAHSVLKERLQHCDWDSAVSCGKITELTAEIM